MVVVLTPIRDFLVGFERGFKFSAVKMLVLACAGVDRYIDHIVPPEYREEVRTGWGHRFVELAKEYDTRWSTGVFADAGETIHKDADSPLDRLRGDTALLYARTKHLAKALHGGGVIDSIQAAEVEIWRDQTLRVLELMRVNYEYDKETGGHKFTMHPLMPKDA